MYGNKGDDVVRNNGGLGRILQGNDGNDTILTGYLTNGNIQGNNGDDCMVVYQSTNTPVSCGAGTDKWNGAGTRPADCESTYLYCCPGVIC